MAPATLILLTTKVSDNPVGHQYFPDGDALDGRLAVVWQDSREDSCYSVQLPVANTSSATNCDSTALNTYAAVSTDGSTFGPALVASSVGQMRSTRCSERRTSRSSATTTGST